MFRTENLYMFPLTLYYVRHKITKHTFKMICVKVILEVIMNIYKVTVVLKHLFLFDFHKVTVVFVIIFPFFMNTLDVSFLNFITFLLRTYITTKQ